MKKLMVITFYLLVSPHLFSQITITPIPSNFFKTSMRGLYAVDENIIWASGTGGVVMKTTNNKDWETFYNPKLKSLDYRDIHAFNENEAIIMSSGDGCEIYKTKDGGKTWLKVYENKEKRIFFDGMDFWDNKNGIAMSDPINEELYLIETKDGGETWQKITPNIPKTLKGEACFAASGTSIKCVGDSTVYIGTGGGEQSRVFMSFNRGKSWQVVTTPMRNGDASGIYSLTFIDDKNGVAVGGNYLDSLNSVGNCIITSDGGKSWRKTKKSPEGYQSCVATNKKGLSIACGTTGVNVSFDKGNTWKHINDDAYNSCVLDNYTGWLVGNNGKMASIK